MESRSRMSRWPRSYSSGPGIAESASRSPSDNVPRSGSPSRSSIESLRINAAAASRLRLAEALEIPAHGIEEDENDRKGEVDQESKGRADEGDRDRHRS